MVHLLNGAILRRPKRMATGAFGKDKNYFQPSQKKFIINLRVDNLEWLLKQLKAEGVEQLGEMQTYKYGKFAHIIDP